MVRGSIYFFFPPHDFDIEDISPRDANKDVILNDATIRNFTGEFKRTKSIHYNFPRND